MTTSIFSPAQLDDLIKKTLPTALPEGHRNAIVGNVDTTGAHVAALVTIDKHGHWQVKAAGEYDWNGDTKAGVEVLDSW